MSKLHEYKASLSPCAMRAFSDAAISLSLFFDTDDNVDYKASDYYYQRYRFNLIFAFEECGIKETTEFEYFVREYARELNR